MDRKTSYQRYSQAAIFELVSRNVNAQVELLAAVADGPRQAVPILHEVGVSLTHFSEHDTAGIYLALEWAGRLDRPSRSKAEIADMARTLLRSVDSWEDDNFIPAVGGCRWGPGPLAALLHRVTFDPSLVRAKAEMLKSVAEEHESQLLAWENRRRRCA